MATIQIYNACVAYNKKTNFRAFNSGSFEPDLKHIFGRKALVDAKDLDKLSLSERKRHEFEDNTLKSFFLDSERCNSLTIENCRGNSMKYVRPSKYSVSPQSPRGILKKLLRSLHALLDGIELRFLSKDKNLSAQSSLPAAFASHPIPDLDQEVWRQRLNDRL